MRERCTRCDGNGCEEGCGLKGGCEMAYSGPDSHRICTKCNGSGRQLVDDDVPFTTPTVCEHRVPTDRCPECSKPVEGDDQ